MIDFSYFCFPECVKNPWGCASLRGNLPIVKILGLFKEGAIAILADRKRDAKLSRVSLLITEEVSDTENKMIIYKGRIDDAGVNVIVPHFDIPECVEISYHSKPAITPLVICLPSPISYESDKVVPYKYREIYYKMEMKCEISLCVMLKILPEQIV